MKTTLLLTLIIFGFSVLYSFALFAEDSMFATPGYQSESNYGWQQNNQNDNSEPTPGYQSESNYGWQHGRGI